MKLKIVFFGDIIGKPGRLALKKLLPELKKELKPHLIVANAENLAHGVGITAKTLEEMKEAGVDFFTSGNHIFDKKEAEELLDLKEINVIRPANYPPETPGPEAKILDIEGNKVLMVNLMGRVFMKEDFDCPFRKFDQVYKKYKKEEAIIIVDFHAEATSEKIAFGHFTDGRATAVVGTHTHVPTADNQILKEGTGYISDIGMVGVKSSVIGVDKENVIKMFKSQRPLRHEIPEDKEIQVNAVYLEIDTKSKKVKKIERVDKFIKI
ncbi:MAG: TIGR00282 family metallophosphoesterase [Patescibacteria group bacterium]|nr:TIGR00282 family metallophosphoesterase [Patescibacteria group bacterium]